MFTFAMPAAPAAYPVPVPTTVPAAPAAPLTSVKDIEPGKTPLDQILEATRSGVIPSDHPSVSAAISASVINALEQSGYASDTHRIKALGQLQAMISAFMEAFPPNSVMGNALAKAASRITKNLSNPEPIFAASRTDIAANYVASSKIWERINLIKSFT